MSLIKGRTITFLKKVKTGVNDFGEDVYTEVPESVENVLIQAADAQAQVAAQALYDRYQMFTLHIPKTDDHDWYDCYVILGGEFGDRKFHQFGDIKTYQKELCPLEWNKQVDVLLYEQVKN